MEYGPLRDDVREMSARTAGLLREAPNGEAPVTGLDWTVADLGGHMVTVGRRCARVARGQPQSWKPGDDPHGGMATFNREEIDELAERDPAKLATLLEESTADTLDAFGPDGDRPVDWGAYRTTAADATAVWLGEFLVHGLDLARTLGRAWPIRRDQAAAVFDGLVPALPAFVDRAGASRAAGTYHLHVRDGGDYTIEASADGTVAVERGKPARADLHVSASPVAYLLVGYGRAGQWGAVAKGQITAWGRKPWLALRFPDLFASP